MMNERELTMARDRRKAGELRRLGWRVIVVWECELRDTPRLARRLQGLLPRVNGPALP